MTPCRARTCRTRGRHMDTQHPSVQSDSGIMAPLYSHLTCGGTMPHSPASQAGGTALGTLLCRALLWQWRVCGHSQQLGGSQALEVIEG